VSRAAALRRINTEALKRERPLADVIASYGVALRREGAGTYRGLCPFHQERTPSFWVDARDPASEHYFCFGQCGAHGDVITFVMDREGCSFQEACERLGSRVRPPTLGMDPTPRAEARPNGRVWEHLAADSDEAQVLELAVELYQQQLWRSDRGRTYLQARGVSEDVARAQRLGYAESGTLVPYLRERTTANGTAGLLAFAADVGLVVERPAEDRGEVLRREFFVDRLIVPELRGGRPIWCIGRAVDDQHATSPPADGDSAARTSRRPRPKYLSLPGEKPVLGLEHVLGRQAAYLVEGPLDWLAAVGWGLPALAICGTHFPADRLPALGEALAIYGVFDPDRAGLSAAERFAPLFGSRWRPVRLPNRLDLADLAALGDAGRQIFDVLVGRARATAWQDGRL